MTSNTGGPVETKAREFYVRPAWPTEVSISDTGACLERVPGIEKDRFVKKYIHVIEYSAFEALKIKYDRLWDSRDLAKSDLQKRCEEKDETNQKLRFSWLEVQREKLELQSKLAEQAAEIERLGKEKIVPHDTFWNKIESDNQIKSLTAQNSILREGLEDIEMAPRISHKDSLLDCIQSVARETLEKADKVKGE